MPELRARFYEPFCRTSIFHTRAEPDDLYDPPPEAESDAYLVDAEDFDVADFDIYGVDNMDEDDE